MQKFQRVAVQKETIEAFTTCEYVHTPTKKVIKLNAESINAEIAKAKFYENGSKFRYREIIPEKQEKPVVQVVSSDCLIEALKLKKEGFNPLVLNMASATSVGGGYKGGAGAQEENLFRRTNLFQYHEPNKKYWYPIPEVGGIYCPNVAVIRSSEQNQYEFLEVPETMCFVAVSAIRRPKLIKTQNGKFILFPEAKELTKRKIQAILNIGLDNGHDAIVLSAFGCGAYRNPPSIMAQLFYEVISTEYAGGGENLPKTYRHISFAIFDDHNSNKEHNPEGNFLPFRNQFANGLDDDISIHNVADAVSSVLCISQEDNESTEHQENFQRNRQYTNQKGSFDHNQNRHERGGRGGSRGGGRGVGRGRDRGRGRGQGGSSQQTTLDAWRYKPSQDHVDQLVEMGYSAKNARRSLYQTKGNIEEAADWLKQNAVPDKMIDLSLNNNN